MATFYDQTQLACIPNMSQHTVVNDYVIDGCYFNECLRNDDFGCKADEEKCRVLQSLFENITAPANMYVFRGVDKQYINNFDNPAFTSTSPNFKCAREFANNNIVMHIHIPEGTVFKAIRINKDSTCTRDQIKCFDNEDEILFGCGTRFVPTDENVIQDIIMLKLEHIKKGTDTTPYVWSINPNIEIRFYTLVSNTPGGMIQSTVKKFVQVTGHPRRLILRFSNKKKYILLAKQRVFLSDIRGKYRYVV